MNTAADIKQRLDIVAVISEYVQLKKAGRNFKALCPFHTEKTPSFFVFPERQSWRCFGCGVGGDLISFVMRKEGLDFGGALKTMAQRAGVPLVEKKTRADEGRSALLYRINETAAQYYHQLLLSSSLAQGARKYVQRRGLGEEILREFQLGFSLDEGEGLKQHLSKQGYSESDLVAAGLVAEKGGRTYDRFRGRIMFPICDAKGRVGGFGARALDDSVVPKYLNSAAGPVFDKSSILYGIDRAQGAIREQGRVVIVEGYMDVITAHQCGFRNVVASMGTALTEKQIAVIKGLTAHVCLCLDPDAAGDAATLRGIEACRRTLDRGVREMPNWLAGSSELRGMISIISLPEGKDPDQVIRESPDEWRSLVDGAQPLMDYLLETAAKRFDVSRPEGKTQVSQQLLPLIAEMKDGVEREVYLGKLSRLVGLNEKTLAGMAAQLHKTKPGKERRYQVDRPFQQTGGLEEYCLCLLLKYPSLRGLAGNLTPDHFDRSENREVFVAWHQSPDDVQGNLDAALHQYLQSLIDRQYPPLDRRQQKQALADCIRRLDERRLRSQLIFEAESALETGGGLAESSARLTELQRQHATLGR
ncbi:DNA primase [Dehalococcoidia bacterium]|nr:DNA primase [Dehalococcoidia bacterium]